MTIFENGLQNCVIDGIKYYEISGSLISEDRWNAIINGEKLEKENWISMLNEYEESIPKK